MTSPFEAELRAKLREYAGLMPADTADRLAHIDYWPARAETGPCMVDRWRRGCRGRLLRRHRRAAVLLIDRSAGRLDGLRGLERDTYEAEPAAVAKAIAACNWLADHRARRTSARTTSAHRPTRAGSSRSSTYPGPEETDCISDGRHTATGVGSDGHMFKLYAAPGPDQLGLGGGGSSPAAGFPGSRSRGVYSYTLGLAGSNITAVTFRFGDRMTVDATVQNGWYFAWWPNSDSPTSVRLTTKSGSTKCLTVQLQDGGARMRFRRCRSPLASSTHASRAQAHGLTSSRPSGTAKACHARPP